MTRVPPNPHQRIGRIRRRKPAHLVEPGRVFAEQYESLEQVTQRLTEYGWRVEVDQGGRRVWVDRGSYQYEFLTMPELLALVDGFVHGIVHGIRDGMERARDMIQEAGL